MIKRDVVFNEVKLIFKKSAESVRNDSMKNVDFTDLLQSVRVRNTDLQQSNIESDQSIIVSNQVIESMFSISADEDDDVASVSVDQGNDENVASVPENDQASAEIFPAENPATELATEATLPTGYEPGPVAQMTYNGLTFIIIRCSSMEQSLFLHVKRVACRTLTKIPSLR
jgi:hypothetical protein